MRKKKLNNDTVRVIKIGKEALFEFIYEKMIDEEELFLDVDLLSVSNSFAIDWETGQFIFCAYRGEDQNGNLISLPKEINLQKLLRTLPDTIPSMYQNKRYQEYTKEELIELSEKD
ncbi:MAG: hypothetical protein IJ489_00565 [Clostridia bacterium]|nr:hypothetical protein [Clostridia bacterium]